MTDEQMAREFLQGRRMPLNMEENAEWHQSLATLLARRALEARQAALEEAAQVIDREIAMRERYEQHMEPIDKLAEIIRSLAAASKAAGGERT